MKRNGKRVYTSVIVLAVAALSAICYHSIEEIHYLKSFFPAEFTVREAVYASAIELIKVIIAGIPLFAVITLCVLALRGKRNGPEL